MSAAEAPRQQGGVAALHKAQGTWSAVTLFAILRMLACGGMAACAHTSKLGFCDIDRLDRPAVSDASRRQRQGRAGDVKVGRKG